MNSVSTYFNRLKRSNSVRRLMSGTAWSLIGASVSRVSNLVSLTIIARLLSDHGFGLVSIVIQTMGFVGVFAGAGLGATLTRFVAQYREDDPDRAGRVIVLISMISYMALILMGLLVILLSSSLATNVFQEKALNGLIRVGILIMIASVVRTLLDGILAGLEDFRAISISSIIHGIVTILACVVLTMNFRESGALFGLALGLFASCTASVCFLFKPARKFNLLAGCFTAVSEVKVLSSFAAPSVLTGIIYAPFAWAAIALLARSPDGISEVGGYNAAYIWQGPIMFIPMIVAGVSIPMLTQAWEARQIVKFKKIVLLNLFAMLTISIVLAGAVAFFSEQLLALSGQEFKRFATPLIILSIAAPIHGVARVLTSALYAMGHAWTVLAVNLLAGFVLVGSAVFFVAEMVRRGWRKVFY